MLLYYHNNIQSDGEPLCMVQNVPFTNNLKVNKLFSGNPIFNVIDT